MLGSISCVTISAHDLDAVQDAYAHLDYRVSGDGRISDQQAELWQAPEMTDAPFILLSPAAGNDFCFRFVNRPHDPDYVPLTTFGWNASELIVQNVDAMAEKLADSPFDIIGPPKNLSFTDDIRAMQMRGPADEVVYLTEFKNKVPGLDEPPARCPVDRTFIVILGGPSMDDLQNYFADEFAVSKAPVMDSRITLASKAFGLPLEHRYPIAALALQEQSFIEVDELPDLAKPRTASAGLLVPGIAIVSFRTTDAVADAHRSMPCDLPGYASAAVSCRRGVTGELIETIHV
ncbi:MAG: hypothetical protein ACR2P6_08430 [Gammaproteobacteria bacterium]